MSKTTTPPGWRAPALVQTTQLVADPVAFMKRSRERFGPVFRAKLLGYPRFVYVAEPALARQVFATDRDVGRAGEVRREFLEPLVGKNSLLCLEDEAWTRERKLVGPPFHGAAVERYADEIKRIARQEVASWPAEAELALRPRMQAITLEVILQLVLGVRDSERRARLRNLLPKLIDVGGSIFVFGLLPGTPEQHLNSRILNHFPGSPLPRFWKLREEADALIYEEVAERRRTGESGEDVLSMLLAATDEDGTPMTDAELRDELITLLEAGHETTATALAWTFERLVRSPEALERLVDEVDSEGGDDYLGAVVKEALRVRPVVIDAPRLLRGTLRLGDYELDAGWYVSPAIPLVNTDPAVYDEPLRFKPERFLGEKVQPDAWIPFGGGRRRCLGSHLAMLELRSVVAEVIRNFELRAVDERDERARLRHVTLVPARGGLVGARRRTRDAQPASAVARSRTAAVIG